MIFRRGSCNPRPQCSDADAETPRDLNARMARGDFLLGNRNLTRVQLRRPADPRAAFAIADLDHHIIEFWRVPYDIGAVQKRMEKAGLPFPLVERLGAGR